MSKPSNLNHTVTSSLAVMSRRPIKRHLSKRLRRLHQPAPRLPGQAPSNRRRLLPTARLCHLHIQLAGLLHRPLVAGLRLRRFNRVP